MHRLLLIPTTLLLAAQGCHAQKPAPWLLEFNGKSTNQLATDKRFPAFLREHISGKPLQYWINKPTVPSHDALDFLHGPPDDVRVVDNRYAIASACVAHDAVDCGLLWVDTETGATVFAASVYSIPAPIATNRAHLWLFSNTRLDPAALPGTLVDAVGKWSAHENGDGSHTVITDVTLVQPSGTELRLPTAAVHVWEPAPSEKTNDKPSAPATPATPPATPPVAPQVPTPPKPAS